LAVNANDVLDYVGRTVTSAARVQGASEGGDVVLTGELAGDGAVAERFSEALNRIKLPPFELAFDGLGSFGRGRPRALWAGIAPNEALATLSRAHEHAALAAGLEPEVRNFHPHVTLARMRNTKAAGVATYLAHNGVFVSSPFPVTRFVLYSARDSRGGGPYVVERAYPLAEPGE
ncbi:MAG: RNA 2',3'-cyclic phosphodiesterase, partial [Methyloligellaceae bacterium]